MVIKSSPRTESTAPHPHPGTKGLPLPPPTAPCPPVGHNAGVIGLLVLVHLQVALADEALLFLEGADDADPQQGLVEVGINGGAAD